jgi:hypothetical protein
MKEYQLNSTNYYPILDGKQIEELVRDKELLELLFEIMEKEKLDDLFFAPETSLNRVAKKLIVGEIENEDQFIVNLHNLIHCFIKAQRYDVAAALKLKTYSIIQNG